MDAPPPPNKPQVVTLEGPDVLLHNSGIKRGQTEGLTNAATAMHAAVQHFRAKDPDILPLLQPILEGFAKQFADQAKQTGLQQNELLGQYISAKALNKVLDSQAEEEAKRLARLEKRKRKLQKT